MILIIVTLQWILIISNITRRAITWFHCDWIENLWNQENIEKIQIGKVFWNMRTRLSIWTILERIIMLKRRRLDWEKLKDWSERITLGDCLYISKCNVWNNLFFKPYIINTYPVLEQQNSCKSADLWIY